MAKISSRKARANAQQFRPYATFDFKIFINDKDEMDAKQHPIQFHNGCERYSRLEANWRIILTLRLETKQGSKTHVKEKKVAFNSDEPMGITELGAAANAHIPALLDNESFDSVSGHVRCLFLGTGDIDAI